MKLSVQNSIAGVIAGPIAVFLGFFAAWGLIPGLDIETVSSGFATTIAAAVVALAGAVFNAWLNRAKAVIDGAVSLDVVETIVVKDKDTADDHGPKVVEG